VWTENELILKFSTQSELKNFSGTNEEHHTLNKQEIYRCRLNSPFQITLQPVTNTNLITSAEAGST
jgi:hypothetical protein